ncbi:hypothetical protein GCK32_020437 [Trichostrongylus colubriformis]|uniref:Uncharacterized protein n=1 Tax=Trichostrongylus colubriformis TaxID=6319 RepID=A0AAN8IT23_TRICO
MLLLDSWIGFTDHAIVLTERYLRRVHDLGLHHHPDFHVFRRDNLAKVISQKYRQFCAPVFVHVWRMPGWPLYMDGHPGRFATPTYGFNEEDSTVTVKRITIAPP